MSSKVLFLYVNAGYGHRKVAEAVYQELSKRRNGHQIEIFDALEKTNFIFEKSYSALYHQMVMHASWLWAFLFSLTSYPFIYPVISPLRTAWNWLQSFHLRKYIQAGNYDYIVFTHFFPAEVCATLKRTGRIKAKLLTIVTDVIPHRVWANSGTDYYWIMADESAKTLMNYGVERDKIYVKGIPVSADFMTRLNPQSIRKKLELREGRLTILFSSGSFGMGPTEEVLASFNELKDQIQAIVICGKNKVLLHQLNNRTFPFPIRLFGFVDNMPELMSASDLLIAKPGGATMCESLAENLPMIMTSPIPGQESHNADWLSMHQAAFKVKNPSEIKDIVKGIIQNPKLLESMKVAVQKLAKPKAAKDLADAIIRDFKI